MDAQAGARVACYALSNFRATATYGPESSLSSLRFSTRQNPEPSMWNWMNREAPGDAAILYHVYSWSMLLVAANQELPALMYNFPTNSVLENSLSISIANGWLPVGGGGTVSLFLLRTKSPYTNIRLVLT